MLTMNRDDALREVFARNTALQGMVSPGPYNTGVSAIASNAVEYISMYLLGSFLASCLPRLDDSERHSDAPLHVAGFCCLLSTSAALFKINRIQCIPQTEEALQMSPQDGQFASPSHIVETIRRVFMLSVRDAALVLRVTRPTIYQWQSLTDLALVRAHGDRDRMKAIYRLALEWEREGSLPGRWLLQPLAHHGCSVLDILSAEEPDTAKLREAHSLLQMAVSQMAHDERERSREAVKGIAQGISKMGDRDRRRKEQA